MLSVSRLKARWWIIRNHGDSLNRRVSVERYLWGVVEGKNPPIDADKARELALKLGVPSNA